MKNPQEKTGVIVPNQPKKKRNLAVATLVGAAMLAVPGAASAAVDADAAAILVTLTDTFVDIKTYIITLVTFGIVLGLIQMIRRGRI